MFNPNDWYWRRQDGSLYASARLADVDENDEAYIAWLAAEADRLPTPYPRDEAGDESDAELARVLSAHGVSIASADPRAYPLNRFQFEALLLVKGLSIAGIEAVIDALPFDDFDKAVALSRLRNAVTYNRDHPLVDMVREHLEMSVAELDQAWMQAKDLR